MRNPKISLTLSYSTFQTSFFDPLDRCKNVACRVKILFSLNSFFKAPMVTSSVHRPPPYRSTTPPHRDAVQLLHKPILHGELSQPHRLHDLFMRHRVQGRREKQVLLRRKVQPFRLFVAEFLEEVVSFCMGKQSGGCIGCVLRIGMMRNPEKFLTGSYQKPPKWYTNYAVQGEQDFTG